MAKSVVIQTVKLTDQQLAAAALKLLAQASVPMAEIDQAQQVREWLRRVARQDPHAPRGD